MFMREFFDVGVAPARGLILARSRAVARWAKALWLICLLASLLLSAYAQTTTRGFGNGANQFTMDFVTIGNPNNPADTTGTPNPVGSVAYTYNLGKYEVSREQIDKANTAGGLGITMSDMSSYGGNGVNKPATGVTWHEAARFVNWLNTSTGGTAAYKFVSGTLQPWSPTDAGYNASNLFRNSQAKYVIASRDEWYKGAYGSPNGTWYNYPTGSDSRPSAVASGAAANTAVYDGQTGPADINNAGGLSAYGTMGQGGNVWEWNETAHDGVYNTVGESLEMRGGSWDIGSDYLPASYRNYYVDPAIDGNNSYGFRVAVVSDFNSTINNGEVTITGYTGTGGAVEIPATIGGLPVRVIGYRAFDDNKQITGVVVPEGITHISAEAFQRCNNLDSITLPSTLVEIGSYAFLDCKIRNLEIPEGVIEIKNNAFMGCGFMETVQLPSTLIQIGDGAFDSCGQLTEIIIPADVRNIGVNAFKDCGLLGVVIFQGEIPPVFDGNAFSGITNGVTGYYPAAASAAWEGQIILGLTLAPYPFTYTIASGKVTITGYTGTGGVVEIPATIGGLPVTEIGNYAFQSKSNLTAVILPNGVTTIGQNAFSDCANLVGVTLPSNLTRINSGAFLYCPKLEIISIPRKVTRIEDGAFFNCPTLAVVNFEGPYPSFIGDNSFSLFSTGEEVSRNAKGYYLASESATWTGRTIDGLTLVPPDTQSPVITLIGANPLQIYKGATFSDPGATVTDNVDTTRTITGSGTVNTATVGNYTWTYNTTDAAGNLAVLVTRTVNVVLDPSGDEDGDGVSNGAESAAGTNPLVKNILRFQTIDMLALGKGNFSIPESNGAGGGTTPAGFRFGTAAYYGGVPFFISNQANQVWHAARAPGGDGSGPVSVTFPMAVNNVYGFYTLAGLWWGVAGSYVTYTFNFSDGSSYSKELTNNVDLRDYNIPSSFANSINGTTTQNVFVSGRYHLDRQWIDFSVAGHGGKNLVSFTVIDRGASGSSRIFLAAATAQVGAPGQIPPGATDTDGDGILDNYELGLPLSTKPDDADTDDDGLSDGTEISGTTDPLVADVDNDGLKDGVEFAIGTNPLVADSDGDGTPDGDEDADNDGGSNRIEVGLGNSLTVANVYNRLINGSFEDGTVKPSPGGNLTTHQDNVPGWKTTANNDFTIELWGAGFTPGGSGGSSGGDGNVLAELNYIASGTLYQDVIMTVGTTVSYSFLHRGRSGTETIEFRIDRLVGGPGSAVEANFFNRQVSTGNGAWVRYRGTPVGTVQAGKTYRFSYSSIFPDGGSGNLLDGASFEIDRDADGLTDSVETNTRMYVSANNTGTDPLDFDSDDDGLKDGEEVVTYGTNPLSADTDSDGAPDGVEVAAGTNPSQESSLPKPGITLQPVSITRTSGEGVTFSVTATNPAGSPSALTYQWYKNGTAIPTGTNPTFIILPLTIAEAGNYSVVVSNLYGAVTSNIASLTVNKATPIITTAPTATSIAYGQTLEFSTLSGGVASVAGTFAFTTPSTAPNAGAASQGVTFRPSDTANYNTATVSVSVTVNAALISSGFSHTLYLGAGATTVTAWGLNTDGRLGVGDTASPVNWAKAVGGIPSGDTVTGLAAGGTHSLILAGGEVYAAGSDRFGQLGQGAVNGVNKTSFTPVAIPSSTPVAVTAGGNHSLIVTASGKVFACGDNTYGQLAQPATTLSSGTLVEVVFPGLSTKIVSVVAGADHNLAVDEGGGVWVWGRNDSGQLGKNTRTSADRAPVRILSSGAKSLAAGYAHSLILKQDGSVLGFGRNTLGQAGQSSGTSYAKLPIPIPGLSGIRLISAGTDSSFAIDGEGQLRSWGYNAFGELLLGYASPSSSPAVYDPTPSPIATNVFNVSGGGYSSLAVGAQGVIFGGRNDVGQAGNGPDPDEVVGDYYYDAGNLALSNLTMDLAGTIEDPLYDQIFVGKGAVTLNGILNLMFVGTYTGPVFGTPQTFDLIWAKNGITLGTDYRLAFNQSGYWAETERVAQDGGEVLRATVGAVVTAADLAKAVSLAEPNLDGVEMISYGIESNATMGVRQLSVSPSPVEDMVEMIYSYKRPTGGVMSGAEYFVGGTTYRVEYTASLQSGLVDWNPAVVTGTTITPLGDGYERATLRISASGSAGFLRLEVVLPPET
jgi:alpha-tubulin suppressor-like RCC1 family protein/formylglycine-generating enzyme required for sulfatase activity